MKDFIGKDIYVGDRIVYLQRLSIKRKNASILCNG